MKFLFLFFAVLLFSCSNKRNTKPREVERSFYYWKSVFKLSDQEKLALQNLNIQTLYIKYFDVDWDNATGTPLPIAQIMMPDSNFLQTTTINIIPTIFITNETIFKLNISQADELAGKIITLVNAITKNNGLRKYQEMQIDCDWTATTKDKYFTLLKKLQELDVETVFSVTVRLHQIKYNAKTGVPPVKKAMLMCYNMGNLSDAATVNSIIEVNEMKKYLADLQNYPIPLDVALPIFDWKVIFRNNKFKGLVKDFSDSALSTAVFTKIDNRYVALKDTMLQNYEIKKGDMWRNEQSDYKEILKAAEVVNDKLAGTSTRVALYHLDNLTLKKYTTHELENIYDAMR